MTNPTLFADPAQAVRLQYIDYDSKSPTYSTSVTIDCPTLEEAVKRWAALDVANQKGAQIRAAADRRYKATEIKKLYRGM